MRGAGPHALSGVCHLGRCPVFARMKRQELTASARHSSPFSRCHYAVVSSTAAAVSRSSPPRMRSDSVTTYQRRDRASRRRLTRPAFKGRGAPARAVALFCGRGRCEDEPRPRTARIRDRVSRLASAETASLRVGGRGLRLHHHAAAIHAALQIDVVRTAQLARVLVLDVCGLRQRVGRPAEAPLHRRCFPFRDGHIALR